jgi:ankyrin repeat protein
MAVKKMLIADPKLIMYDNTHSEVLVNKRNDYGFTPLYIASKNGNLKMAKLLIKYGA